MIYLDYESILMVEEKELLDDYQHHMIGNQVEDNLIEIQFQLFDEF